MTIASDTVPDLHVVGAACSAQCLALYRYDENGTRIDNITDWALEQFRQHYGSPCPSDIPLGKGDLDTGEESPISESALTNTEQATSAPLDKGGSRGDPHAQTQSDSAPELSNALGGSPCPSGIPLGKGDSDSVAPINKGGSRGDQIDYAAIAQQRNLPYKKGHLPYNPKLVDRAKALRKEMTKAEKKLWYDFLKTFPERVLRQRPIDHFIVDFYCPALNLVIEVDGGQHYSEEGQETDAERTAILESYGLQVLRFRNDEVLRDFESVCQVIEGVRSPCPSDIPLGKGDSSAAPLDKGGSRGDQITKLHIFHYTYAVLHHPAYRTKYELNLKREFPRLPYYPNFHQWAAWGKALMDLHLTYETAEPYGLKVTETSSGKGKRKKTAETATIPGLEPPLQSGEGAGGEGQSTKPQKPPKPKLKADKAKGHIILDTDTTLTGVPAIAWDYKLGNRSALEWILDQYKEKNPRDPTIRELFNTYRFADYKEHVIDLLQRVCTVSVETMHIIHQMPDTVEHEGEA